MNLTALMLLAAIGMTPDDAYEREVKPVLARRCAACHGALKQQAKLRLDTAAAIRAGGDSGPAVEPGRSAESPIVGRVTAVDESERMPPEGEPLKPEEVAALRRWIDAGAEAPALEAVPRDPRDHWAFRPPARPGVPESAPGTNPVDAFLAADQRRVGLTPRPRADKAVLLRRVTQDLTGLPPSREALRAFLADPAADAYERAVDRLLAGPQYGERWGRHWMDVWRYSDWDGFGAEIRESRPFIWHWRDWIVESLNADLGYDRMIVLMLAADEAAPEDDAALRATGFLARNWDKFSRVRWLDNNVEHTAKAFLGLTLACARCHDHKYDPIPQADYYRFRAVFEPHEVREDRLPLGPDASRDGLPRAYDGKPAEPTYLFVRGDDGHPDKSRVIEPGVPGVLSREPIRPAAVPLPLAARHPALREAAKAEMLGRAARAVEVAGRSLAEALPGVRPAEAATLRLKEAERDALAARYRAEEAGLRREPVAVDLAIRARRAELTVARREAEIRLADARARLAGARRSLKPGDDGTSRAFLQAAGTLASAAWAVASAALSEVRPDAHYTHLDRDYPAESTGRRLALANWIASPGNPLTARVAVNHVWARHFGRPLVETVFDFGLNGRAPTHPALLDWLATEFTSQGWSLKRLHRLIVTSDAYTRESTPSGPDDPNLASDPENLLYWRMNARRIEAEAVRDNLLAVAGTLDPTLGGPDLDPDLGMTSTRRSLYLRHAQEKRALFLKVFDSPSAQDCYRRVESVIPQQALALANSPLALAAARRLAAALSKEAADDDVFISDAFEAVLGRATNGSERIACEDFLIAQAARLAGPLTPFDSGPDVPVPPSADPKQRAREDLIHVLFNHNDFVTIR